MLGGGPGGGLEEGATVMRLRVNPFLNLLHGAFLEQGPCVGCAVRTACACPLDAPALT